MQVADDGLPSDGHVILAKRGVGWVAVKDEVWRFDGQVAHGRLESSAHSSKGYADDRAVATAARSRHVREVRPRGRWFNGSCWLTRPVARTAGREPASALG